MADGTTTNQSFVLPEVGASEDTWGAKLNANWSALDTLIGGVNATEFAILDGATVTTAELNILDGVTATASELNALDGITATVSELNILDGVTATAAELNILDGVTATAANLNLLAGATATGTGTLVFGTSPTIATATLTSPTINVTSDAEGDLLYRSAGGGLARLGIGGTDQVLTVASGLPSWADAAGGLTVGSAITTTSGTAHDFTGIPAGANRITLMIAGTSLAATGFQLVQLGDSGGFETSGYNGQGGGRSGETGFSTGFQITTFSNTASHLWSGVVTLVRVSGNAWAMASNMAGHTNDPPYPTLGAGSKTLSGELTQIRLTSTTGASFDAGVINVLVE